MKPEDPRKNYNINNFKPVNSADYAVWGTSIDIIANGGYEGTSERTILVPGVVYDLDRYATAPLDWTFYAKREFEPEITPGSIAMANLNLRVATATGGAGYNFLYNSSLQNFTNIDNVGRAFHFVAESMKIDVEIISAPFGAVEPTKDRLLLWISRGRPKEHFVRTFVLGDGGSGKRYIKIPPFAVSCHVAGWRSLAGNYIRNQCQPTFVNQDNVEFTYVVPATDTTNELVIPTGCIQMTENEPFGAFSTTTFVEFKCLS